MVPFLASALSAALPVAGEGLDLFGFAFGDDLGAVYEVYAAVIELDHDDLSSFYYTQLRMIEMQAESSVP